MSCRVLHRGVEEALLRSCAESADGKANGSIGARAHTRALVTLVELQETVDKMLFSPLPFCGMNLLPSFLGPLFLKLPSCRITGLGVEAIDCDAGGGDGAFPADAPQRADAALSRACGQLGGGALDSTGGRSAVALSKPL